MKVKIFSLRLLNEQWKRCLKISSCDHLKNIIFGSLRDITFINLILLRAFSKSIDTLIRYFNIWCYFFIKVKRKTTVCRFAESSSLATTFSSLFLPHLSLVTFSPLAPQASNSLSVSLAL